MSFFEEQQIIFNLASNEIRNTAIALGNDFKQPSLYDNNRPVIINNTHIEIYKNLSYNPVYLTEPMSKSQAFCGLIKPLFDNFDNGFIGFLLLKGIFIDALKHFYSGYTTRYSQSFSM